MVVFVFIYFVFWGHFSSLSGLLFYTLEIVGSESVNWCFFFAMVCRLKRFDRLQCAFSLYFKWLSRVVLASYIFCFGVKVSSL